MTRPLEAASTALERTREVLFRPFEVGRYVALAFCAWLYRLGSAPMGMSGSSGTEDVDWDPNAWQAAVDFAQGHVALIAASAVAALVVGVALWAGLAFVQSRGSFMLIDNIVRGEAAIVGPWKSTAAQANALFGFRMVVGVGTAAVAFGLSAVVGAGLWTTWQGTLLPPHMLALGLSGIAVAWLGVLAAVAIGLADELVAPLMYARGYGVLAGYRELGPEILRDPGGFALYLVLRFAASLAVGVLGVMVVVLSCGAALLPFVGTVALLPALVFVRAFSVAFVGQFSDDLRAALHPVEPAVPVDEPEVRSEEQAA